MMLEEQGDGTAHITKSPSEQAESEENHTAYDLQRRLMDFDSDDEPAD